jgi:hypothetical protein
MRLFLRKCVNIVDVGPDRRLLFRKRAICPCLSDEIPCLFNSVRARRHSKAKGSH